MDADTRHQLKQNELAEALGKLRDWDNPSNRYLILAIALLVILFAAWKAWSYSEQHAREVASRQLGDIQMALQAGEPSTVATAVADLRALIADASDPGIAGAARLRLASFRHNEGLMKPDTREEAFAEAARLYDEVIHTRGIPASIEATATFGLATVYESMRKFDEAKALYDKLQEEPRFRGSPYVLMATERVQNFDELREPITLASGAPPVPQQPANAMRPPADMLGPQMPPPIFEDEPQDDETGSESAPPPAEDAPANEPAETEDSDSP